MIPVEEALARVLALAHDLPAERVSLRQAAGRVLAANAVARRDQPPFDAAAMDGYAVRASDLAPGKVLRVIGEAGAGHAFTGSVGPGEATRIFTGAPVPEGAGRAVMQVVMQEDVESREGAIILRDNLDTGTHVRPRGQDFRQGDSLTAPRRLGPRDLALLASMNIAEVSVGRRPVVALIQTGDELVMPGEEPAPDQIIASNSFAIAAMAEAAGAEVRMLPIARDTEASLRYVFVLAAGADVIVTIGGASVGDHDLVGKVAQDLGLERAFYKVAMRPGKPLMAGRMGTAALIGLPGNPVSAIICARLFLLPLLQAMQGLPPRDDARRAVLDSDIGANGARTHFMRASLVANPDGDLPRIRPFAQQDSSMLSILATADALLVRPVNDPARNAGDSVSFLPM